MAYSKTVWKARIGTFLNKFVKTNETSGSVELTNDPTITIPGTPFSVDNMNKIEQGIYDNSVAIENNIDQGVKTSDSPTFASINTGHGANELYPMNQAVRTTDNVHFANMNPPILSPNDYDAPPQIGVGGFTFAKSNTPADHPTVTLPAIGTFICTVMRFGDNNVRDCFVTKFEGGSVIEGFTGATGGTLHVLIFRIA